MIGRFEQEPLISLTRLASLLSRSHQRINKIRTKYVRFFKKFLFSFWPIYEFDLCSFHEITVGTSNHKKTQKRQNKKNLLDDGYTR